MSHDWTPRGYVVEELLGSGATADVWRARVATTGARVALKRIHLGEGEPRRGDVRAARAEDEARLLASLDHPNMVRLHDAVRTRDSLVLVLDLAERGCLRDLLRMRGRLVPGEVIGALAPVAAALAHLHNRCIVHGDVSAANILFAADGSPMLADVGVARLVGQQRAVESTPAYIDPVVAAGQLPTPASDVFMLAAVAVHALTGQPLWRTDGSAVAALTRAVGGVPADLAERLAAAGVPGAAVAALGRALVDDPARRCSAVDLALDLRHSCPPLALEFTAGRAAPGPGAARFGGAGPLPDAAPVPSPLGDRPTRRTDAGRPEFVRPSAVTASAQPPTRMVRPRPRPQIPRSLSRGRRGGLPVAALAGKTGTGRAAVPGRHRVTAARPTPPVSLRPAGRARWVVRAVGGAAVLGGLAAALLTGLGDAPRSSAETGPRTSAPERPSRPAATTPVRPPATSGPSAVDPWVTALAGLDRQRAAAYGQRRPELLASVYSARDLVTADAARLRASVPAGCGLRGVRTRYAVQAVRPTAAGAVLDVTARIGGAQLVCHGAMRGAAAATGPVRLRIELRRTADGPRIVAERVM